MGQREPRLHPGAAPFRCLDHHRPSAESRHHRVAHREGPPTSAACPARSARGRRGPRRCAAGTRRSRAGTPAAGLCRSPRWSGRAVRAPPREQPYRSLRPVRRRRYSRRQRCPPHTGRERKALRGGTARADDRDRPVIAGVKLAGDEQQRGAIVNLAQIRGYSSHRAPTRARSPVRSSNRSPPRPARSAAGGRRRAGALVAILTQLTLQRAGRAARPLHQRDVVALAPPTKSQQRDRRRMLVTRGHRPTVSGRAATVAALVRFRPARYATPVLRAGAQSCVPAGSCAG